jgi:parallel beta-helix repeat protein
MPAAAGAELVPVASAEALRAAIVAAVAGDEIVLAPGTYTVIATINCSAAGTSPLPIVVRAATAGTALVRFDALEGFYVTGPHWRFEDLVIEGVCAADDDCEHAFHLAGNADGTAIRRNVVRDFNAQIKSNGDGTGAFPDDVVIDGNELYDTRARATANPVTKIDVVGGRRWIVRGNTISDYEKGAGDTVSYAAFLKGNSREGLFERNLVICERETSGGVRLGLSLGGGGTATQFCEGGDCTTEHQDGILRNNVIVGCPDVGIYLNRAAGTIVEHNTLYDTTGIDVRFSASSATLRNNLLSAGIHNRDGGTRPAAAISRRCRSQPSPLGSTIPRRRISGCSTAPRSSTRESLPQLRPTTSAARRAATARPTWAPSSTVPVRATPLLAAASTSRSPLR